MQCTFCAVFIIFGKSVALLLCSLLQVGHYHHPEPKVELKEVDVLEEADEPDHRTAPVHLRHMLSHTEWHHMPPSRAVVTDTADAPVNGRQLNERHVNSIKFTKSVSFAGVENILGGE